MENLIFIGTAFPLVLKKLALLMKKSEVIY